MSCSESLCRERPLPHSPFPRTQIDGDTRWYLGLNLLFVKTARAIWKDDYLPALVANGLLDCDKLSIDAVRHRGGRARARGGGGTRATHSPTSAAPYDRGRSGASSSSFEAR